MQMRNNPKDNWVVDDLESVSKKVGLEYSPPSRGSHFKVSSPYHSAILTIPAKRPLKPVYIRKFVALTERHLEAVAEASAQGSDDD